MKMTKNQIHQRARELLENCLSKVPSLRIVTYEGAPWFDHLNQDFIVRVFVQDLSQLLLVAVIPSGQPRVARNALNLIARFRSEYPNSYGILIAPFVSSRTAEICKQNGAGYLDSAGNCFLSFQTIFIQREGLPNPAPARRELRSLYAPKSTRVLRVLLANARQSWRYQRLAREANVSLGQVANVLRILRDREWLTDEDSGVKLAAPAELLAEWTASYNFKKNVATDYYSLESPVEIEKTLGSILNDRGIRYALTGFSGAARVSPAVRYQRVMAFVEAMPEDALARLKLKPVDSGANVTILSPYDEGVFYGAETVDDLQVVHPIQLYLDLRNFKGRGEEAAAAILGDIILPSWRI